MKKFRFFAAIMITALFVVFLCSCTEKKENEETTGADVPMETVWSEADIFEAPTEAPSKKDQSGQDEMLSRIEEARQVYALFTSSKPKLDKEDTIDGGNGIIYYKVTDERLSTGEKFNSYLLSYFSKETVERLLNVQMYIENDKGELYAVDVGMTTDNVIKTEVLDFTETEDKKTLTMTVSRDFDSDGKADSTEKLEFISEPVGEDGKWVFTQFSAY